MSRSSLGRLSEFSRQNKSRYKKGKRDANLNKKPFLIFGVLRLFLGSSLVRPRSFTRRDRESTRGRNLNNCALLSLTSLPPWVGEAGGEVVGIVAGEASG